MRISDWSSDVCSSDLLRSISAYRKLRGHILFDTDGSPETVANIEYDAQRAKTLSQEFHIISPTGSKLDWLAGLYLYSHTAQADPIMQTGTSVAPNNAASLITFAETRTRSRSEEHTSELQSLMRISYAVFCL